MQGPKAGTQSQLAHASTSAGFLSAAAQGFCMSLDTGPVDVDTLQL